jgi:flavodoxin
MAKKALVAYFSCSGVTKGAAQTLADAAGADLYEIKPEVPYTAADLNWTDKKSRNTVEMKDPSSRPAIAGKVSNMGEYDIVFLGFPIWWYVAPTIINTFLESYDFSGKTIILFATSGGSGFGKTMEKLKGSVSAAAEIKEGRILNGKPSKEELAAWIESIGLQ